MSGLLRLGRPSPEAIERIVRGSAARSPSYGRVGSVEAFRRRGFAHDERSAKIGSGEQDFDRARKALFEWRMFDLDWLEFYGRDTPPESGQTVAILLPLLGVWWVNLARVAVTYDEEGESGQRFGFVYVTMPQHAEVGQERFEVLLDRSDGSVHFRIEAVSRPSRWYMWPGYPWVRRLQRRFGLDAMEAMRRAVSELREAVPPDG